jgi:signal transduction histidine kinase
MRSGASDFLVKNFDSSFNDVLQMALSRLYASCEAEREKAALARDRDLLRIAIENSNDGLAVIGRDGRVRYCNSACSAFLSMTGAPEKNFLAIPSEAFVQGEKVVGLLAERFKTLEPGGVWATEVVIAGGTDTAFDISLSAVPEGHDSALLLLWLRDVRERKRRERFQRDILSTTTHDLKGPLGAISISCDVLLDRRQEDQKTKALLERIAASASSAIHLIDEFLNVRRIEEGSFVMRPAKQDVGPVLAKAIETFRLSAETRGINLSVHETLSETSGCVDALALERVIANLVSNALKFTPRGGNVSIRNQRVPGGLVIAVQDSGTGMEPADAQRLFQRYSRLDQHTDVPGTGLGLFIVKSIVSAHGGNIDVTSAPGKGTSFEIFFPDAPPINERGEVLCLDFA